MQELKDLLNERDVTLEELAQKVGVTRQTLHNIKKGIGSPSLLTIKRICDYFGKDYKEYLE